MNTNKLSILSLVLSIISIIINIITLKTLNRHKKYIGTLSGMYCGLRDYIDNEEDKCLYQ
ncbi:MAG: hypothetical protein IKR19_08555 [Acholeplasmatales bacterium]|nr:hypothetical protein [Acholeplasmatales bacterium]